MSPCRRFGGAPSPSSLRRAIVAEPPAQSDEELLDRFQRAAFGYFLDEFNPENGLVADTSRAGAPASIAVVGFALSSYPVGVERGWMTRADAAARTLVTLRFFWNSPQSEQPDATGYKGFYYHFLDMKTGKRVWQSELSLIDTTLLLAGVLTASVYFSEDTQSENEIRERADAIYRRIDWQWARGGEATARRDGSRKADFCTMAGRAITRRPFSMFWAWRRPRIRCRMKAITAWTATYQWENIYDYEFLYAGPLFIHHFSQAWIDFGGIRDRFMREKGSDYFENSRRATYVQREYARRNPHEFRRLWQGLLGLLGGRRPRLRDAEVDGRERRFFGYAARGVPYGPDDGTIARLRDARVAAVCARVAWPPLRHFCARYPEMISGFEIAERLQSDLAGDGSRSAGSPRAISGSTRASSS